MAMEYVIVTTNFKDVKTFTAGAPGKGFPDEVMSGFEYSAAAEGWGVFTQRRKANKQTELIEVRYGKARLASLIFQLCQKANL